LFCPRDATSCLHYDVVESPAGILLTVHGEIVDPNPAGSDMDHILALDQSFVLRERTDEDDEVDAMNRYAILLSSPSLSKHLFPFLLPRVPLT